MLEESTVEAPYLHVTTFEAFYRENWSKVYRAVAVEIRDLDLANEAVDEAMVRAYESWKRVSGMSNSEGWVYRVAVNWARSRLRRRALWRKLVPASSIVHDPEVSDPLVVTAIRQLPFRQRDVVVLRFLLDMSETDTAKALGIPNGTVKSRLSRAVETLREELA
jgi:RNA polymerase sigma-70 factor (sigma-E family)